MRIVFRSPEMTRLGASLGLLSRHSTRRYKPIPRLETHGGISLNRQPGGISSGTSSISMGRSPNASSAHSMIHALANASPALLQVQNGKPVVVGPARFAEAKPVFPVPKWHG